MRKFTTGMRVRFSLKCGLPWADKTAAYTVDRVLEDEDLVKLVELPECKWISMWRLVILEETDK